mmetsp:Transcript_7237/g.11801  ORF Transcript_7237/g.11801 Transcript_7237/m.11801 type:complete len:95 (+) Transcript_7237:2313-2597(+)
MNPRLLSVFRTFIGWNSSLQIINLPVLKIDKVPQHIYVDGEARPCFHVTVLVREELPRPAGLELKRSLLAELLLVVVKFAWIWPYTDRRSIFKH